MSPNIAENEKEWSFVCNTFEIGQERTKHAIDH